MKVNITKKLGNTTYSFQIEEGKDLDALVSAGFLASMPEICEFCKSTNLVLSSNKAKGFTFIKVVCRECRAKSQLGQYKDGGFFWKTFEKYQSSQPNEEEEIPFENEEY